MNKISSLTFITSNPGKAQQLSIHLSFPVDHKKLDLPEIQSLDPIEIVTYKAKEAYKIVKNPVLVEDTSLSIHALNNFPGPLVKWFLHIESVTICSILNTFSDRSATASVRFALYDGKDVQIFMAEMKGSIAEKPAGSSPFGGIDVIFIPKGYDKTWGEMDEEEQKKTSMRKIALKKLETYLNEH